MEARTPGTSVDSPHYDILKQEYLALRSEILQSISYQHQILLGGYGATGVFFGYVLSKTSDTSDYLPALIGIPFILIGMASLWVVECNRMVRASYYIGRVLWRALRRTAEGACDGEHWEHAEWENWIRSKEGVASGFRERQHRSQCVVVLRGPFTLSVISSGASVYYAYYHNLLIFSFVTVCSLYAVWEWRRVRDEMAGISDLGQTPIPLTASDEPRRG